MNVPDTEVIAVRYATMVSTRAQQFYRYSAYSEPDGPLQLDYYFWLIREDDTLTMVDTGFSEAGASHRAGRNTLIPAVEALRALEVDPDDVSRVIVTHFHYDHIGNLSAFPHARLTVQAKELEFWTGAHGRLPAMAATVEAEEIEYIRAAHAEGRVDIVDGDHELSSNISVSLVGGHCPGQQTVTVTTAEAQPGVVLCSDAVHFYEETQRLMPHHGVFDIEAMFTTYERTNELEASGHRIVPGHDPAVMHRHPPAPGAEGLAVKIL